VPVFVAVLGVVTMLFANNTARASRRALLTLQAAVLAAFLAIGGKFGSFATADSAIAIFAGMLGVAAMATQNALIKLALPGSPSTAVMTTNTTQLAVDLAIIARGRGDPEDLARARHRTGVIFPSVAAGCACGGLLEIHFGLSALALPVALAAIAIPIGELWRDPV